MLGKSGSCALRKLPESHFFDVAPAYGQGKAEEVLGRALQGRQEPVVIATKVRLAAQEMHDVAGAVRTSVEASLRRLRRETVDVLHIHNRFTPRRGDLSDSLSAEDTLGPVLDAYRQMQHAGKTRFIGISAMEPDVPTVRRIMTKSGHMRFVHSRGKRGLFLGGYAFDRRCDFRCIIEPGELVLPWSIFVHVLLDVLY